MFSKIFGEAKGIFNIITLIELVFSIMFILLGLIFFSSPNISKVVISVITGLLLILNGVSSIYAFIKKGTIDLYNNNLIYGIFFIVIGIISLFVSNILAIFIGIYFLGIGIQKINYSLLLKKFNESSWIITGAVGILLIIIGIIAFFTSGESLVEVVGICLFGYGAINLVSTLLLRRRSKYFIA